MKKITSVFLSVIMLASLCLLAACNSVKPKDAGELFFDTATADIFAQSIMDTMGIDTSEKSIIRADTKTSGKALRADLGISLDSLSVGEAQLASSPIMLNASALFSAASKSASGSLNYTYDTDSLSVLYAFDENNGYLKLDGVTEKYVKADLSDIISASDTSDTSSDTSSDTFTPDPEKVTETEAELTVNGVTTKVRCLEYVIKGDELASLYRMLAQKLENAVGSGKILPEIIGSDDFRIDKDFQPGDDDFASVKRYFDVNTPVGCELIVALDGASFSFGYKTAAGSDAVYATFEASGKDTDGKELFSATGSGASRSDGTFTAEITVSAEGDPVKLKLSGKSEKTDDAKATSLELSVGVGSLGVNIPVTVTVAKSDGDGFDVTASTEFSVPSTVSLKLSASCKLAYSDALPALPASDEISSETLEEALAGEGALTALMSKLEKTFGIFLGLLDSDSSDF